MQNLDRLRLEYLVNAARQLVPAAWTEKDFAFLAEDIKKTPQWIHENFISHLN